MAKAVTQKLKIKERYTLLSLNAPSGFKKGLGEFTPRSKNSIEWKRL